MTTIDLSEYRPNVGIIIINKEDQVWVGERADIPGAWQMPQGGMEDGESIKETAYKELKEETGINATEVTYIGETAVWSCYDFPGTPKEGRGEKWKGQKQRFVLFYFKGKPKNINLHKATDKEFSRWKWQGWQDVVAEAADFRKPIYKKAFAFFDQHFK